MGQCLRILLAVAIVIRPVALDLGLFVARAALGQAGPLVELGLRIRVFAGVRQGFTVESSGERRLGRGAHRLGSRGGGGRHVVVPVLDPGEHRQDVAVVGRQLEGLLGLVESRFLFGLVVEQEGIVGQRPGVVGVLADLVLELRFRLRVLVLKHQVERTAGGPVGLGRALVAGSQQKGCQDNHREPPHIIKCTGVGTPFRSRGEIFDRA